MIQSMSNRATATRSSTARRAVEQDQRVFLHGVSWEEFEQILAIAGETRGLRMTYLEGELELMSPSHFHEGLKKTIGRLVEIWAIDHDLELQGYGSWTLKKKVKKCAAEPDECYILGMPKGEMVRPDLAIEVEWTTGGIEKLEVYRRLQVREVWIWEDGRLNLFLLRGDEYVRILKSRLLPDLDMKELARCASIENQTAAIRAFRKSYSN